MLLFALAAQAATIPAELAVAEHRFPQTSGVELVDVGDVDGDGSGEVAVVSTQHLPDGSGGYFSGRICVIPAVQLGAVSSCSVELVGTSPGFMDFAASVAAGDFNGDGHVDLAVGATRASLTPNGGGAVYVFHGPLAGRLTDEDASLVYAANRANAELDAVLTLPDVDGDGYDELLIGADARVHLVRGGLATGVVVPDGSNSLVLTAPSGTDVHDALAIGDLDGDGATELVVGAPKWGSATTSRPLGAAFVVSDLATLPNGTVPLANVGIRVDGIEPNGQFGQGVWTGDLDGDGADELIVHSDEDPRWRLSALWVFAGGQVPAAGDADQQAFRFVEPRPANGWAQDVHVFADPSGAGRGYLAVAEFDSRYAPSLTSRVDLLRLPSPWPAPGTFLRASRPTHVVTEGAAGPRGVGGDVLVLDADGDGVEEFWVTGWTRNYTTALALRMR